MAYFIVVGIIFKRYFLGKCDNDGFYYNDEYSFMICSNGNSYEQPCAPGSRNSGYNNYQYGNDYYYHDFCDVNLVDQGYAVRHGYGDAYDRHDNFAGYGRGYNKGYGHENYVVHDGYNKGYARNDRYNAVHDGYGKGYNQGRHY